MLSGGKGDSAHQALCEGLFVDGKAGVLVLACYATFTEHHECRPFQAQIILNLACVAIQRSPIQAQEKVVPFDEHERVAADQVRWAAYASGAHSRAFPMVYAKDLQQKPQSAAVCGNWRIIIKTSTPSGALHAVAMDGAEHMHGLGRSFKPAVTSLLCTWSPPHNVLLVVPVTSSLA